MKKFIVSFSLVLASALYIILGTPGVPADGVLPVGPKNALSSSTSSNPKLPAPAAAVTLPPVASPPAPLPTPAPVSKPKGAYNDGTYTGSVADAYYGSVQVQAVIQGGKITNVNFLQYPTDRSTSRYINGQAMPVLQSEAIQAQNANVDIVSGATDTSQAFQQSLGAALAQAKV